MRAQNVYRIGEAIATAWRRPPNADYCDAAMDFPLMGRPRGPLRPLRHLQRCHDTTNGSPTAVLGNINAEAILSRLAIGLSLSIDEPPYPSDELLTGSRIVIEVVRPDCYTERTTRNGLPCQPRVNDRFGLGDSVEERAGQTKVSGTFSLWLGQIKVSESFSLRL